MADNSPPARGFPVREFEARLERAQRMMAAAGFDALLLTTEPEVRYFSGFLTPFWQSPTRPWFLVVPGAGKPIAVIPEIGSACMARTWIEDIRAWSSPHPTDDGVSLLAETLSESVSEGGRIGLPMGPETHLRMPLAEFERLRKRLADREFCDATPIVRGLRMVKSAAEIEKIAHACAGASDAFAAAPGLFSAGMALGEAFRAFKRECLASGVDDVAYLVGGAGPGGYDDIISPPSDRPLAAGDVMVLDTGCVFDGYFCDFDRNFAFGSADDRARRAYDTLFRATDAALDTARPGRTCADLFAAMQSILDAGGGLGNDVGRMGHGLGMQLTEGPSLTPFDDTVLAPGMVLTIEPGMRFAPGRVMVHEENIAIADGAPRLLSRRAPPALPVIG